VKLGASFGNNDYGDYDDYGNNEYMEPLASHRTRRGDRELELPDQSAHINRASIDHDACACLHTREIARSNAFFGASPPDSAKTTSPTRFACGR